MRRLAWLLLATLSSCAGLPEGRFGGLGPHRRGASTLFPEAQAWFDQGLAFLYAFNHDEAIRSFRKAADLDPACAAAWWAIALANGPHINNPVVDEAHAKAAWAALGQAQAAAGGASAVERALIDALAKRYADPQPADRSGLDRAYADAMRAVWKAHPKDPDVGALFAEALMDLRPWDLWTADGTPQPGTGEVLQVLEAALELQPDHPLACHLYIHALEASPEPGKATAAADRLRDLAPGLGHLVHMPSHIDVRTGRWADAVEANRKAIRADDAYVARSAPPGFYRLYMAHNRHMLVFAAMNRGQERLAVETALSMVAAVPPDFVKENAAFIDGFLATPLHVEVRFGRWDAVLARPEFPEHLPLSRALRRHARAAALGARGRAAEARAEQKSFLDARRAVPKESVFGNNPSADLLAVAEASLEGELLFHEGKAEPAIAALRDGVKREDALRYDEPPDWIQSVRHSLGAVLLKSGRAAEAEAVYEADLQRFPGNGWSLRGLASSLRAQGKEADGVEARFRAVWSEADGPISSSCLCVPAK